MLEKCDPACDVRPSHIMKSRLSAGLEGFLIRLLKFDISSSLCGKMSLSKCVCSVANELRVRAGVVTRSSKLDDDDAFCLSQMT